MSCYEALAASYDGLTRDIPYEKYLRFFKSLLKQYGVKPKTVLDLACGTGSLSVLLAYAVLGVDRSEDMLTVAAEKAMELEENQPFFVAQPMQRLRLPQPVDACVCALDSINYVTKPQDVQKTFCRIYESLRPGGLFVDDTWERSFEEHVERAYTPQELSGWLMDAGFAQVGQFGNLRLAPPQPDEMRIFFAAKKGT